MPTTASTSAPATTAAGVPAAQPSAAQDPTVLPDQGVEKYQPWPSSAWWSKWDVPAGPAVRQKATNWWGMIEDLTLLSGTIDKAAADWDKMTAEAQRVLDSTKQTQAQLSAWTGTAASTASTMSAGLFNLKKSLTQTVGQISGNAPALRQLNQTVADHRRLLDPIWQRYLNDLNTLELCTQDAKEMAPLMMSLAGEILKTADVLQNSMSTELEMPKEGAAATGPLPNAPLPQSNPTVTQTANPTTATPKVAQPGVVVSPNSTVAASAGNAGNAVTPTATPTPTTPGLTLAGGPGAATLAPPSLPSLASGPTVASAPAVPFTSGSGFGVAAGGVAGPPAAGLMPFMPMGAGATGRRPTRDDERLTSPQKNNGSASATAKSSGAGTQPTGMVSPAGAAGLLGGPSARPKIRPGKAIRATRGGGSVVERTGVPQGLLGRAGQADPTTAGAHAGTTARRPASIRRRREEPTTVQFLDEDAWETADAGSGLVAPEEPPQDGRLPGPLLPG
jgi:hypothetical protein